MPVARDGVPTQWRANAAATEASPVCEASPGQPPAPRKILIYSHDTFGLGNIRRMLAIAEQIVHDDSLAHVLLITGSPMLQGFRISERIDFVKLPCLSRDRSGKYAVRSLPLGRAELLAMRSRLIASVVEDFRPDLLLVDKKPLGVEGELAPALEVARGLPRPPALVLMLRDILDAPKVTRKIWSRRGYHDVIKSHYDLVLVAGQPDLFDVAREYHFPASTRLKLRYCGYIQRRDMRPARPCGSGRVLVTPGGGGDGAELIRRFLEAVLLDDGTMPRLHGRIITGPEMPEDDKRVLRRLAARQQHFELVEFSPDPANEMAVADVVVGMCGYNSICEVLSAGVPAVVVPRVHPVAEQVIRAERFAARGLVTLVRPDELTPERLLAAVRQAMWRSPRAGAGLDFGGLGRISYWLSRLMHDEHPHPAMVVAGAAPMGGRG